MRLQRSTALIPLLSLCCSLTFGCIRQSPQEAEAALRAMDIPFNQYEFVRHAASSPPLVLGLFLNALMHPNSTTVDGYTALMAAARAGNARNVAFLLESGASVRPKAVGGLTALMMAAQNCTAPAVVRALLKAGAQAEQESEDGSTALTYSSPISKLTQSHCDPEIIRILAAAGGNVNHRNHHGWTPLLNAVRSGESANVSALLSLGADPNLRGGAQDVHPLIVASQRYEGGSEILRALLKAGANPNVKDPSGHSILLLVRNNSAYSNLLLEAGATPLPSIVIDQNPSNFPLLDLELLPPIDCITFQRTLNLSLPCYGEYH